MSDQPDNTTPAESADQSAPTPAATFTDAGDLEEHLARLEEALADQLKAATDEDYDRVMEIGEKTSEMLKMMTALATPITHVAFERIRQIQALHHQLGLTLSSRSEEMAEQLSRVRNGRNGITAYQKNL